jgi:Zn-dependent peptidase ImmA (M78 family)
MPAEELKKLKRNKPEELAKYFGVPQEKVQLSLTKSAIPLTTLKREVEMKEYLGKKILWVTPKTTRLWEHSIRCAMVKELSSSGEYVMMGDGRWYHTNQIQVLEVLGEGEGQT